MLTLNDILAAILIPAVLAGSVWGITWKIWKRNFDSTESGKWAGALAVSAAFAAGYLLYVGWQGYPPKLAEGWLPFVAIAAILAGILESTVVHSTTTRRLIQWGLVLAISIRLQTEVPRRNWAIERYLWDLGLFSCGIIPLLSLNHIAAKRPGASVPLSLWVWAAGSAAALGLTGSLKYGVLGGTTAAIMGAAVVVAWIHPRISFAGGATSALVVFVGSLLMDGYFYSELPAAAAITLALAPLMLWLGEIVPAPRGSAVLGALMRMALVSIPVGVTLLILAWPMLTAAPKPYGTY